MSSPEFDLAAASTRDEFIKEGENIFFGNPIPRNIIEKRVDNLTVALNVPRNRETFY